MKLYGKLLIVKQIRKGRKNSGQSFIRHNLLNSKDRSTTNFSVNSFINFTMNKLTNSDMNKLTNSTDFVMNKSTNFVMNKSTNCVMNTSTNCVMNSSTNSVMNSSTNFVMNSSTNSVNDESTTVLDSGTIEKVCLFSDDGVVPVKICNSPVSTKPRTFVDPRRSQKKISSIIPHVTLAREVKFARPALYKDFSLTKLPPGQGGVKSEEPVPAIVLEASFYMIPVIFLSKK